MVYLDRVSFAEAWEEMPKVRKSARTDVNGVKEKLMIEGVDEENG